MGPIKVCITLAFSSPASHQLQQSLLYPSSLRAEISAFAGAEILSETTLKNWMVTPRAAAIPRYSPLVRVNPAAPPPSQLMSTQPAFCGRSNPCKKAQYLRVWAAIFSVKFGICKRQKARRDSDSLFPGERARRSEFRQFKSAWAARTSVSAARSPPARSRCRAMRHRPTRDGEWVRALLARKPTKVAPVALANKTPRIVWAVMMRGEVTRRRTFSGNRHRRHQPIQHARVKRNVMASGRAADREDPNNSRRKAARSLDRDPISERHQGQRSWAPHHRAEHMTAPDHLAKTALNLLRRWGPSTYETCTRRTGFRSQAIRHDEPDCFKDRDRSPFHG